ncbi:hypothetical protein [Georgenia deserti]|uniref:Leucine rich repeat variant domain-containing protein n=1 Tax=Georgenia deserti TaxID=2093781 RepID=A0ABW4L5G0_9MICO
MSDPVGNDEQADLAVQAADPTTPLTRLQYLAQHHPELRASIAENPSTYPALLEWLGNLGMPDVDAALARRSQVTETGAPPAPLPETDQPDASDTAAGHEPGAADTEDGPTGSAEPATADPDDVDSDLEQTRIRPGAAVPLAETPDQDPAATAVWTDPDLTGGHGDETDEDTRPRPVERRSILGTGEQAAAWDAGPAAQSWQAAQQPAWQPAQQPEPAQEQPTRDTQQGWAQVQGWQAYGAADQVAGQQQPTGQPGQQYRPTGSAAIFPAAQDEEERRRPWWPLAVLAAVAAILVIIVILQLTGGDDEPEQGASPAAGEPTTEQQTEEATTGDEEASEVEAAREDLTALPENSSCEDPAGDAGTFATFAAAAAPDGQWAQASDADLVIDTLQGLQDSCSNVHAVEVAGAITDGGGEAPEALARTVDEAGTDWVDFARPAPDGAAEVSTFASPSGNILCDLTGDPARCTIVEHDFGAPDGCDDGTTMSVGMDGEASPDCENPVGDQGVALEYGESGVSGFFACTSEEDGMTCWNTLTGHGFSLARAGRDTF